MTRCVTIIDPEDFGVERAEIGQCLAHGGQLVRSATCHVLRIKNQECPLLVAKVTQCRDGAAGGLQREVRGVVPNIGVLPVLEFSRLRAQRFPLSVSTFNAGTRLSLYREAQRAGRPGRAIRKTWLRRSAGAVARER